MSLNIAFIALGFPPNVGGTELYNLQYALRLHKRGHKLRVLTWKSDQPGAEAFDQDAPYEIRRLEYDKKKKLIQATGVAAALSEWKPDVCFISRASRMLPEVVKVASKYAPVVLSVHELREKHRARNFINRWRVRRRYGLDRAKFVTVNSKDTRERLVALGLSESQLHIVYPGVDLAEFTPKAAVGDQLRETHGWAERPILLTVARLAANKGHRLILEALPNLIRQFPQVLYVIVGKGPLREELEAQVQALGLESHVHFTGLVDSVEPYYQACDIYCMPSIPQNDRANAGEGFGIAYVEAGACGKPVLASNSGGGAEIVVDGETGRVVDPHKLNQVQAALADMLENPERRRLMGENAIERVKQYDWEIGVEALEAVLTKACAR